MSKKTLIQTAVTLILLSVAVIGLTSIVDRQEKNPEETVARTTQDIEHISLVIEDVYQNGSIVITSGDTVLDVLRTLDAEYEHIQLDTKEYPDMGVLVTSIAGRENGAEGRYWQYEVNGTMPQISVDAFELKQGDSIKWYFKESEF